MKVVLPFCELQYMTICPSFFIFLTYKDDFSRKVYHVSVNLFINVSYLILILISHILSVKFCFKYIITIENRKKLATVGRKDNQNSQVRIWIAKNLMEVIYHTYRIDLCRRHSTKVGKCFFISKIWI